MSTLLAALGLVFVAELGDKTQLVALGLGARHRLAPVLVGVTAAYMATVLLSVTVGGLLGAALPTRALGLGGGVLFLGFAAWTLRQEDDDGNPGDPDDGEGVRPAGGTRSVVLSVAGAMFVAELGDKTMLATAALAAQGRPVLVWIGATAGITLAGVLGVLLGRALGSRLPARATRIGSAALLAGFGVTLVAANL
ncbi:MAG TPA: TMEM165/GDT1 family protein [Acidimicrobiales bacterium]|nr:TMEM165/GDT1 family protein [Acidimicrobiales bacterium]